MNPLETIEKYYSPSSELYKILIDHSQSVTQKALLIAASHPHLCIDRQFVMEAGMIHDIGIYMTDAPTISCFGTEPYMAHGYLGNELMQKEGYPSHGLVCERHSGAGLLLDEIIRQKLPVPHRDMMPISIEEQVICFADCFYSKTHLGKEKSVDQLTKSLAKYGERSSNQFKVWCDLFL